MMCDTLFERSRDFSNRKWMVYMLQRMDGLYVEKEICALLLSIVASFY